MSLRQNVAATAISRFYLTLVGLLALPVYRNVLGADAYGLVALYLVLQVWLQWLDLGLAATLARESARSRAGARPLAGLRGLTRMFELGFGGVGLGAVVAGAILAPAVVGHWLQLGSVAPAEAATSLGLMVACIVLRLAGDLYRGLLSGFEQLRGLAAINAVFGTVRLLGVLPFLAWSGATTTHFFGWQLAGFAIELLVVRGWAFRLMPVQAPTGEAEQRPPIRQILRFSLAMSAASAVWVLASQVDKLLLSGLLPLREYGAYGLAVAAAAGVSLVAGALADTLVPRVTALHARHAEQELRELYRSFTQWSAIAACTVAGVMACHAQTLLWVWTGDALLASEMSPVLRAYALGNAALALGSFPYFLQLAQGRLRLHLLGTALMFALLLPGVIWATARYGAVGAATAWLVVNSLYLLGWTALAHARFAPGLHGLWWRVDILPIALLGFGAAALTQLLSWPTHRLGAAAMLVPVTALILAASVTGSTVARRLLTTMLGRHAR